MSDGRENILTTKREQCRMAYLLHQVTDIDFSELLKHIEERGIEELFNSSDFAAEQRKKLKEVGELIRIIGGKK